MDKNYQNYNKLVNELLEFIWWSSPVDATLMGIHDYDDTLGNISAEAFRHQIKQYKNFIEALESQIIPLSLPPQDIIDYKLALHLASNRSILLECRQPWAKDPGMYPSLAVWGCLSLLYHNFDTTENRLNSLLCRLKSIPDMLQLSKANIDAYIPVLVDLAVDTIRGGTRSLDDCIPKYAKDEPGLQDSILNALQTAIEALRDYEVWLQTEVRQKPQSSFAVGNTAFQQLVYAHHYVTYAPHDLVLIAEKTLANTVEEIEEVSASIDKSMDWKELIAQLKRNHPDKDHLHDAYTNAVSSARDFIMQNDLISIPQNAQLEICETPDAERSIFPYAAYMPFPPFGDSLEGHFFITPVDESLSDEQKEEQLQGHCIYAIPVIAAHDTYPGHHLQFARAAEWRSPARKETMSSLMVRGWALYAEDMMAEHGFFSDPRERLFQLRNRLLCACRIIIDVGIHTEELSYDEAVRYLVDMARIEPLNAQAEVKRYCTSPTQPMTHLIGRLLVMDIIGRVKRRLGNRFDLKDFHDQFLSYGAIPPPLIAQEMVSAPIVQYEAQKQIAA